MPVESVREASVRDLDEPTPRDSDVLEVHFDDPETPTDFDDLTLYPYSDQEIIRGHYEYESSPRFGSPETAEGTFQIRTGSGLVLVRTEYDRPRPSKIIESLEEVINDGFEIEGDFVPNQRKPWEFVGSADKVLGVKVYTPRGELKDYHDLDTENIEDYPIRTADLEFEHDGQEIRVEYRDNRLEIIPDDDEAREYVIQVFESTLFDTQE